MKPTGFVKKIDEMGRIVIPKSVRQTINAGIGDNLQFFIDGDSIVMKKFSNACLFCGSENNLTEIHEKYICANCISLFKKD